MEGRHWRGRRRRYRLHQNHRVKRARETEEKGPDVREKKKALIGKASTAIFNCKGTHQANTSLTRKKGRIENTGYGEADGKGHEGEPKPAQASVLLGDGA